MNISVLQLNIWNQDSEHYERDFLQLMKKAPDIVCLQECYEEHDHGKHSKNVTKDSGEYFLRKNFWQKYEIFSSPRMTFWPKGGVFSLYEDKLGNWGNVLLWNRSRFTMLETRTKFIYGGHDTYDHLDARTLPVNIQIARLYDVKTEKELLVANIHGWYGGKGYGKGDNEVRIQQSRDILSSIKEYGNIPIILCGDLNLRTDTESLHILEEGISCDKKGNAIKNFNIATGRTVLYEETKRNSEPHASYIITSDHIQQHEFSVDSDSLVSDHAPMILVCEII